MHLNFSLYFILCLYLAALKAYSWLVDHSLVFKGPYVVLRIEPRMCHVQDKHFNSCIMSSVQDT